MSIALHAPWWQLQEAKNRLSEVVAAAQRDGPQTITKHGVPVAIVVPAMGQGRGDQTSAWQTFRDEQVAALGDGVPELPRRAAEPPQAYDLPW